MQNRTSRTFATACLAASAVGALLALAPARAWSQDSGSGDSMASGLSGGDYLRLSGGVTRPVNAQGSLRNWGAGPSINLAYENWQSSGGGVGRVGFGLGVSYAFLPLKQDAFVAEFVPLTGGTTQTATSARAGILEITSNIRVRIPAPLIMPAITFGFGFINWAPGRITYTSTTGPGTVRQAHRNGAELSIGGSLDRQIYDRYALYAEAAYTYGFTSYGRGFTNPGSICASGCDPLKNTSVGVLRGGLRVRVGN